MPGITVIFTGYVRESFLIASSNLCGKIGTCHEIAPCEKNVIFPWHYFAVVIRGC